MRRRVQVLPLLQRVEKGAAVLVALQRGEPHEPEPESLAEVESSFNDVQQFWDELVAAARRKLIVSDVGASESDMVVFEKLVKVLENNMQLALTASTKQVWMLLLMRKLPTMLAAHCTWLCSLPQATHRANEVRRRRSKLDDLEVRADKLRTAVPSVPFTERKEALLKLSSEAISEVEALAAAAAATDVEEYSLEVTEEAVCRAERVLDLFTKVRTSRVV